MDLDDNVSVTSTVEADADSDAEWEVKHILAEGQVDGQKKYLIEWEGFPLHAATWEPKEHFQESLLDDWFERKRKQQEGVGPRFHLDEWRMALIAHFRDKYARHETRNRERQRRGLEITLFNKTLDEVIASINSVPTDQPKVEGTSDTQPPVSVARITLGSPIRDDESIDSLFSDYGPDTDLVLMEDSEDEATPEAALSAAASAESPGTNAALNVPEALQHGLAGIAIESAATGLGSYSSAPQPHTDELGSDAMDVDTDSEVSSERGEGSAMLLDEQNPPPYTGTSRKSDAPEEIPASVAPDLPTQTSLGDAHLPQQNNLGQKRDSEPRDHGDSNVKKKKVSFSLESSDSNVRDEIQAEESLFVEENRVQTSSINERRNAPTAAMTPVSPNPPTEKSTLTTSLPPRPVTTKPLPSKTTSTTSLPPKPSSTKLPPPKPASVKSSSTKAPASTPLTLKIPSPTPTPTVSGQPNSAPVELASTQPLSSKPAANDPPEKTATSRHSPTKTASTKASPTKASPTKASPAKASPTKTSPTKASPTKSSPIKPKPKEKDLERDVSKTCVIGSMKLHCSFRVPQQPAQAKATWHQTFMAMDTLEFSHQCTAQDFLQQLRASELSSGYWLEGSVCSHLQTEKLETLLSHLNSASLGLFWQSNEICLLLYPSRCSDWQQNPLPLNQPPPGHLLRYLAFAPGENFSLDGLGEELPQKGARGINMFDKQIYQKMLPSNTHGERPGQSLDSFFLIFPQSARPEEDLLCRWLRVFNRSCEIRSSSVPGHWAKFSEGNRGAVILHQDCIESLHRMPRFAKLLHSRNENYNFWIFRLPFCGLPSHTESMDGYMDHVGIALDLAFPPGVAVLSTPSFFISQPLQAYNLLKWVWQNFSSEAPVYYRGKLVVCHEISDWLLSLALEKNGEAADIRESRQTLEVRMKTIMLMRQLLDYLPEGEESSIVCAPAYIDGNDEQSLVNWFGWWSISQTDQFRKFTVICSENRNKQRLTRRIKRSALRGLFAEANAIRGIDAKSEPGPLTLVAGDSPADIDGHLKRVLKSSMQSAWTPLSICPYLILNHKMTQWTNYFANAHLARAANGGKVVRNTQLGLFYTLEEAETGAPADSSHNRRSWVAFVRPIDPHRKPWKAIELLIWDHRLYDVSRQANSITESDLSPSQRDLITTVSKHCAKLLPLEKVWAGGFKASRLKTHPVDITLDWFSAAVENAKSWLPATHDELLNRGWSFVRSRGSPSMASSPTSIRLAAEHDATSDMVLQSGKLRMVFEPPKSGGHDSKTCPNRLYQWATAASVENDCEYPYLPTIEWYQEQAHAGRGFEHIRVCSWKEFFEHYKIDNPEK